MTKLLFAMLFWATAIMLFADRCAFAFKYDVAQFAMQDEDNKQEKEEQGKSKYDNDARYHPCSFISASIFNNLGKSLKVISHEDVYFAFVVRPNTPPPDMM